MFHPFFLQKNAEVWDFPHLKFSGNTFHGWGLPRSDGSQHGNLEMFHGKFEEYCGENEMRSKLRKKSFQEEGVGNFGERRCV